MSTPNYFTCTLGEAAPYRKDFTNINDFIQSQARDYPDLPAVGFCQPGSNASGPWSYEVLSFAQVLKGSCGAAEFLYEHTNIPERSTVALLCPSTITFLITWLALMRLGHPVLLIAPQCSPSAVASLCQQCEVSHLIHDEAYDELAQQSAKHAETKDQQLELPLLSGLGPVSLARKPRKRSPKLSSAGQDDIAFYFHTSGTSSGMPKPIPTTHFAAAGACPRMDGDRHATFTTTPLYHGGIADLFRAWTSNALIWLFPGKGIPITAKNIVKCLSTAGRTATPPITYFASVPYVLEMMASDDNGLQRLRNMEIVSVGGAALPPEVGARLVKKGVNLVSRFGSAECGFLMSSHRDYNNDKAWDYLRAHGDLKFDPRDDGLHELIVPPSWPVISKTDKVKEDGSFATCDLFKPHPTIPNAWRYDSRADSQITLVTGKKFDPAPLEDAIAASLDTIQDVLIFGDGKPYPGALLFRSEMAREDSDEKLLKGQLGQEIRKLNKESQKHAQIPESMLVLMPYIDTPLPKSSKGTVLRRQAEERYASNIATAYEGVSTKQRDVPDDEVESFVLEAVRAIMSSSDGQSAQIHPDTDLFAHGVDSVASVQIRHAVAKLLPESCARLPLTIVQDSGSVQQLSQAILGLRHNRLADKAGTEDHAETMRGLVQWYSALNSTSTPGSQTLPTPPESPAWHQYNPGKTVLLTGTTGSLGSQLLAQLVKSSGVSRIHLLLRGASQHAAEERVRKAMSSRHVTMPAEDWKKIRVHTCSLSEPLLGLSAQTYTELVQETDVIFHLAWAVDFTLPVRGFKQHFAGLQALLSFALAHSKWTALYGPPTPAKLIFCSSTASVASYSKIHPGKEVPESIIDDAESCGDIGYSRSKWVAENICSEAVKANPDLRGAVSIVRVGQLSGDSVYGVWNKSEAYPLMMSSAKVTGCMPDLPQESVGWVPVDLAAKAFMELGLGGLEASTAERSPVQVMHILNQDNTTTWSMLLKWLAKESNFEVVKPSEWLSRLEDLTRSGDGDDEKFKHPCLKLLEFWKTAYGDHSAGDRPPPLAYETADSLEVMPALRTMKPVDEDYARKLWKWIANNV